MSLEEFNAEIIEQYFRDGKKVPEFEDSLMETLFSDQKFDLILSLLHRGFILTLRIKYWILRSGDLKLYQYVIAHGMRVDEGAVFSAIQSGNLSTFQWIWEQVHPNKECVPTFNMVLMAVRGGNTEIFRFFLNAIDNMRDIGEYNFDGISTGHLDKMRDIGHFYFVGISTGHLDICRSIEEKFPGFSFFPDYGSLVKCPLISIEYIHTRSPLDLDKIAILSYAQGRIDTLKWAYSQGLPLDTFEKLIATRGQRISEHFFTSFFEGAISNEDFEILELLICHPEKCVDHLQTKPYLLSSMPLKSVNYMFERDIIRVDDVMLMSAVHCNRLDLVKWAHSKGAALNKFLVKAVRDRQNWEIFEFLMEVGAPYDLIDLEEWMKRKTS